MVAMQSRDLTTGIERIAAWSGREIVAWLLIAGFLMQPVLAYLVTPIVAHDAKGVTVVMCTLKGKKLVTLDIPLTADADAAEHCAALKLYQIASAAQVAEPPLTPAVSLYSVELLDQTAGHQHHSLHFSAYASRAPPQPS